MEIEVGQDVQSITQEEQEQLTTALTHFSSPIKEITIKNFQSIREMVLPFEEYGVFWFHGNNDIGKSACFRAISALFLNVASLHYKLDIRDDTDSFFVQGKFYDGTVITLSRGEVDYYEWEIRGKKGRFDSTNGKVPAEVREFFNLYDEPVKTKRNLNFNLPGENLPFVNTTAGDNYWLFQKALGTSEYLQGLKESKSRDGQYKKSLAVVNDKLSAEDQKLETWKAILDSERQAYKDIERFSKMLQLELSNIEKLDTAIFEVTTLQAIEAKLGNMPAGITEDETEEMELLLDDLQILSNYITEYDNLQESVLRLKGVTTILESLDIEELAEVIDSVKVMDTAIESIFSEKTINTKMVILDAKVNNLDLESLEDTIATVAVINDSISSVNYELEMQEKMAKIDTKLDILKAISTLDTEIQTIVAIDNTLDIVENTKGIVVKIKEHNTTIAAVELELDTVKDELGVCPLCDQSLDSHEHEFKEAL